MLRSKTHYRKTRRGNVLKVDREHYLRDDIGCAWAACTKCRALNEPLKSSLSEEGTARSGGHYVVIDTNVAVQQIDFLENSGLKNVILLQTVLQEARHLSRQTYTRLRKLAGDPSRKFVVFSNEHHRETYIEAEKGESPNDRNDRAIRVCAEWYSKHMGGGMDIVLVTNDRANKEKAVAMGVTAMTVRGYVTNLKDQPHLIDLLSSTGEEGEEGDEGTLLKKKQSICFPEHLPEASVLAGIKTGKYISGPFRQSRTNYLEGSLTRKGEKDILLQGRENCNRAIDGDIVAVEVFEEQAAPSNELVEEGVQDIAEVKEEQQGISELIKMTTGKVVGIVRRNRRAYCGVLEIPEGSGRGGAFFFSAVNKGVPRIRIRTRQADALRGKRIVVVADGWARTSRYPHGHYTKTLGDCHDKATETEVLLLECDVPTDAFSSQVLECLPPKPYVISEEEIAKRKDLRHLPICSIDPPGCTDIDDALHVRELPNGNYEVGVHIADVTHYVTPGTPLDEEAKNRATTVYLTDQRIHMLPDYLSSELCSLMCDVDRLAFSVIWELTPDAEIVDVVFHKSVIASRHSFTYGEAQARVDDTSMNDEVTRGIRALLSMSKILKKKRIAAGALTLASAEVHFELDSETHDPLSIETYKLKETNSLVEEFMLLANVSVAEKLYHHFPNTAVLRRHPSPDPTDFDGLKVAASLIGFEIDVTSSRTLADSLDAAVHPTEPFFNQLLRIMSTRCMQPARYFAAGTQSFQEFRHYGLASPLYTHFTSPIRRYSDVLVHRLLAVAIGVSAPSDFLLDQGAVQSCTDHLNFRTRMAMMAARASVKLHTLLFFHGKEVVEDAYILSTKTNGVIVFVPKFGVEGNVYLCSRSEESPMEYDAATQKLTGKTSGITLQTFQRVMVKITVETGDDQRRSLVVDLVSPSLAEIKGGAKPNTKPTTVDNGSLEDVLAAAEGLPASKPSPKQSKSKNKNKNKSKNNTEEFISLGDGEKEHSPKKADTKKSASKKRNKRKASESGASAKKRARKK